MAAEGADQVRILDLFVEVADEAATSEVGGSDFVERADLLLAGCGVIDHYRTGKTCSKEHLFDGDVVFLLRDERKQGISRKVFIPFKDFLGNGIQWNTDSNRTAVLGLARDILYTFINDIRLCHLVQVTHSASDQTLEHKDVSLNRQCRIRTKVCIIKCVPFLYCYVIWGSIYTFLYGEVRERIVVGLALIDSPTEKSAEFGEHIVDCVLTSCLRSTGFRKRIVNRFVFTRTDEFASFFIASKESMLLAQKRLELSEDIRSHRIKTHTELLGHIDTSVKFKSLQGTIYYAKVTGTHI